MQVNNKTILSLLIGMGIVCLLSCLLLLKPALNGAHKLFASFEHPPVEETQPTQKTAARRDLPTPAQVPQFPAERAEEEAKDKNAVAVRPPVALSRLSKADVYKLRKGAVAASPFARADYEPSQDVFGGIESYKPWISLNVCSDPNSRKFYTDGPSEESRFINNPTALVALEMPVIFGEKAGWCKQPDTNLVMQKITYDDFNREITVTYYNLPFNKARPFVFYAFNGVNARDLGYPYMYVDLERSTYKPVFVHEDNVSKQVAQLKNFIHVGFSCHEPGGCNNGSPRQMMLEFREDPVESTQERDIYIKLWKEKPASVQDEPDMVERIIIQGKTE